MRHLGLSWGQARDQIAEPDNERQKLMKSVDLMSRSQHEKVWSIYSWPSWPDLLFYRSCQENQKDHGLEHGLWK